MPNAIQTLAVSLLGEEGAHKLRSEATPSKIMLSGREYILWSRSSDDTATAVPQEFGGKTCVGSCITYKYKELAQSKAGIAVDVGGNIGDTSLLAMAYNPKLQLMTFEASPQTYVFLKWNLLENRIPEITENDIISKSGKAGVLAINAAVTSDGKPIEFKYSQERSYNAMIVSDVVDWGGEVKGSSWLNTKGEKIGWITMKVPGFSLLQWFTKNDVEKPVWFKMDCEGCEYDSLLGLHSAGVLERAIVVGEAHPRSVKDESCKDNQQQPECQFQGKVITDTQNLMCKQFSFVGCKRVMRCTPFQSHCPNVAE